MKLTPPRKAPQEKIDTDRILVNYLKSVATALEAYDRASDAELEKLPLGSAERIAELEDLIFRLGCEAEALLWRAGFGHELYMGEK